MFAYFVTCETGQFVLVVGVVMIVSGFLLALSHHPVVNKMLRLVLFKSSCHI